jgi:hypothetical protein
MKLTSGSTARRRWLCLPGVLGLLVVAGAARAQAKVDPAQHLEDFVHYTLTANPDLASAHAEALFSSGLTDAELAELLDSEGSRVRPERFDEAVVRGLRIPEIEQSAAELARRVEKGRLDLARNGQRIAEAIAMLTGAQRARLLARQRLMHAGEYAVPALLKQILEGTDERLKNQCQRMLVDIGRQAVTPLCEALLELGDAVQQARVCEVLGEIGWPHAAPTLKALTMDQSAAPTAREAAERAMRSVLGQTPPADLSTQHAELARQYFAEQDSLIAFPSEPTNNVWGFRWSIGLEPTPVPTAIFGEVLAMRNALRAIQADASNRAALGLFVAADLRRENQLPAGQSDPIYGQEKYSPEFYATVFGTRICQDVLALALDGYDTPLVRDAISALAKTTGGGNLFTGNESRQPLLEALTYPDRRTQYDAALTLARALPTERFTGDFAVVPLLASAVRTGNAVFALVIADDEEDRRTLSSMLDGLQFQVAGQGATIDDLHVAIAEAVGIDLVIVKQEAVGAVTDTLARLRREPKTAAAPVLVQAAAVDMGRLLEEFRADRRVKVGPSGDEQRFASQVDHLLQQAVGGRMTEAEAEAYAIESLAALRDIAISKTTAYDIAEAQPALVDALQVRRGGTRLLVAEILALIDSDRAQRALFDAALSSADQEQVDLLIQVAASIRQHGDRAEQRHVDALIDLLRGAMGPAAEAVARVHGALNLPETDAIQLLPAP